MGLDRRRHVRAGWPAAAGDSRSHRGEPQAQLRAIVGSQAFKAIGGLKGERLSRVPRGFDKDHPAADYLQYKQFLGSREEAAAFATRPDFYKQLLATFKTLAPLCALPERAAGRAQADRSPRARSSRRAFDV